jgi:hypothetical protein
MPSGTDDDDIPPQPVVDVDAISELERLSSATEGIAQSMDYLGPKLDDITRALKELLPTDIRQPVVDVDAISSGPERLRKVRLKALLMPSVS